MSMTNTPGFVAVLQHVPLHQPLAVALEEVRPFLVVPVDVPPEQNRPLRCPAFSLHSPSPFRCLLPIPLSTSTSDLDLAFVRSVPLSVALSMTIWYNTAIDKWRLA